MSKKLFVGNIDWGTTDEDLLSLFSQYGSVEEAIILKDRVTGRPRGFGFVTFTNDEDADKAISSLDNYELNGRQIKVNEAKPPQKR